MATEQEEYENQMRKQQTEQIARATGAGAYVPPQDRYGSAITTLTDPSEDIDKYKMLLRSLTYDSDGNLVRTGNPLMNEEGINAMMLLVNSVVNRTSSMTNYNSRFLETLYDEVKADIITNLMTKRLQYNVDRKDRFLIAGSTLRIIIGFALKSLEEGERRFWKGSVTEVKHTQETNKAAGMSMNPFSYFKK